jgi:hypothetical protein
VRVPVVCPECKRESLAELPAAPIAEALASGDSIRLYARCHGKIWQASSIEREQLRAYLEAANLS